MIQIPPNLELADTAVFGRDLALQVLRTYNQNNQLGSELALAAIVYVLSGGVEVSDDVMVNVILQGSQSFVSKNREKWETKQHEKDEAELDKKKLREIAALLQKGYKQIDISRELGIHKSTLSDRVKLIKSKYSYLLAGTPYDDNNDDQTINLPKSTNPEIRTVRTDGFGFHYPAGISDKNSCNPTMNHQKDGNLSGSSRIPDGRNNVNVNVNVNKNLNSFLSPENPPDSSGEKQLRNEDFSPDFDLPDKNPEKSPKKQLEKNPDLSGRKTEPDKKTGQILAQQVLKNPDKNPENDSANPPMTEEQKAWLRARGYNY